MLFLMALGTPIAFAMLIVGALGITSIVGLKAAMGMLGQLPVSVTMNYELSVVPMFILMGTFVNRANLSRDLYDAAHAFLGHRRGGTCHGHGRSLWRFCSCVRFILGDGRNYVPSGYAFHETLRLQ